MTEKDDLRQTALEHLKRIRPEEESAEDSVPLFREQVSLKEGQIVALYWPMGKEFDVRPIMDDLFRRGFEICLPIPSKTSRIMGFSLWDGKENLVKGAFGVFIPPVLTLVDPDVVIVPLLAFDRKGYRLGRGAGHYDATLADLRERKNILAVGAGYASQAVLFNLPVEDHDQKMDMVVTEQAVLDFRS
jgi:5-formyltetrahydrofolate cyclo-ligase